MREKALQKLDGVSNFLPSPIIADVSFVLYFKFVFDSQIVKTCVRRIAEKGQMTEMPSTLVLACGSYSLQVCVFCRIFLCSLSVYSHKFMHLP
jgi:hypothetical protein